MAPVEVANQVGRKRRLDVLGRQTHATVGGVISVRRTLRWSCFLLLALSSPYANAFLPLSPILSTRLASQTTFSRWSRCPVVKPIREAADSSSNDEPINGDSLTATEQSATALTSIRIDPTDTVASTPATKQSTKNDADNDNNETLSLCEVDVLYERSSPLVYDAVQDRYVKPNYTKSGLKQQSAQSNGDNSLAARWQANPLRRWFAKNLSVAFLPAGVTANYFRFMRWRVMQRFVSANLQVFGTQSLLLGLGLKARASHLGALTAALNWVLKDALGKMVRMIWASNMGRRFDADAKRWRYRASLVYAIGNGLEIVTFIYPALFLLWATLANCCKQISMLTSSSTRTSIYNSFRDGTRENIGDITAKGEAQIAIVDLMGIASGVALSRAVGTSVKAVLIVYATLQFAEIVCMHRQLRSVVYRVLNFERLAIVTDRFVESISNYDRTEVMDMASLKGWSGIPTPTEMAASERLFLVPSQMARRAFAFGSFSRAKLSPDELEWLLKTFEKERFVLIVGVNVKRKKYGNDDWMQNHCHIVLHTTATNVDIVKATFALTLLRRKLAAKSSSQPLDTLRTANCQDLIEASLNESDRLFTLLLRQMARQGWESPGRFMFGRVHMRAEWPLKKTSTPSIRLEGASL